MTFLWTARGKVEAYERGLFASGGYWPWSRIKSYKWESTEADIAILEIKSRWWWPWRIAVPLTHKQQLEAVLERQLGHWPDLNPAPIESEWREPGPASQNRTSRLNWLIFAVMPILYALVWIGIVIFHYGLPLRQTISRGWVSISSADPAAQKAQEAVVQFHDSFSHAHYDKICSLYEPPAHRPDCEGDLKGKRVRLGAFKYTNQISFDGRFDGEVAQVELTYATEYENGEGDETFIWDIREGRAKLAVYAVWSTLFLK